VVVQVASQGTAKMRLGLMQNALKGGDANDRLPSTGSVTTKQVRSSWPTTCRHLFPSLKVLQELNLLLQKLRGFVSFCRWQ